MEFNQINSVYGKGEKTEQRFIPYDEALKKAQAAVFPNEKLKEENFNRVNTGSFQKAVVLMNHWSEMIMSEMFKEKNFRIEIIFNAEERKTSFAIYTIEDGKDGIQQEHSEG